MVAVGFPNQTVGGVGGVQAPHTVPRECAYFRPFFPWAVPFAQLLWCYLSRTVLSSRPTVSILTSSGARSCDTAIWHLSYVLERGILGGTVAAAAISEGAPPSSWQKGDNLMSMLGLGCVRAGSEAMLSNCAHLSPLQSVLQNLSSGRSCQLPAAPLSSRFQVCSYWGLMWSCMPWKPVIWLCKPLRNGGEREDGNRWSCSAGFEVHAFEHHILFNNLLLWLTFITSAFWSSVNILPTVRWDCK